MQLWAVIKRNCLFHVLQHIKSLRHIRTSQFHLDGTLHRASFCGYSIFGDLDIEEETKQLYNGVIDGNRPSLARAITLVESSSTHKHQQAQLLLSLVLQYLNQHDHSESPCMPSFRLGLSGPPGAGKSTFIEYFGKFLTSMGHKVAVLAIDPSSSMTGGSLLADKTRMPMLAVDPNAFIRPSPSKGALGGVARYTNEAIVLCEGAGFDTIIVETVGVGQSEFAVSDMVDMFCLLIPPAGGDELQGIKRGIVEVSDIIVVNKSDGDLEPAARRIQSEYTSAFKFMRQRSHVWKPKVLRVSSKTGTGMDELWNSICQYKTSTLDAGELLNKRKLQLQVWMKNHVQHHVVHSFWHQQDVMSQLPEIEAMVQAGRITPGLAADVLLERFFRQRIS